MTVIAAAIRNGVIAIASDSLISTSYMKSHKEYICESEKIFKVNDSFIGFCGFCASKQIAEHLFLTEPEKFQLNSRLEIFTSLIRIHKILKDDYFVNTSATDFPSEQNQLNFLVVNKQGIFVADEIRDVQKYSKFWAIGSGADFAIGALEALYENTTFTAQDLVIKAVQSACKFDIACDLPISTYTLKYDPEVNSQLNPPSRSELKKEIDKDEDQAKPWLTRVFS